MTLIWSVSPASSTVGVRYAGPRCSCVAVLRPEPRPRRSARARDDLGRDGDRVAAVLRHRAVRHRAASARGAAGSRPWRPRRPRRPPARRRSTPSISPPTSARQAPRSAWRRASCPSSSTSTRDHDAARERPGELQRPRRRAASRRRPTSCRRCRGPRSRPSRSSAPNGSTDHDARSPSVTTSVCPSNIRVGPGPPPPSTTATTFGRPGATSTTVHRPAQVAHLLATTTAAAAASPAPRAGSWTLRSPDQRTGQRDDPLVVHDGSLLAGRHARSLLDAALGRAERRYPAWVRCACFACGRPLRPLSSRR